MIPAISAAEFIRRGVADRIGDVERGRAGLDGRFQHLVQEFRIAAPGVFRAELDIRAQAAGIGHHLGDPLPAPARGSSCSLYCMWISEVARKVWMRGRAAWRTASQALSISLWRGPRQPADDRCAPVDPPRCGLPTSTAIRRTASRSSGEAAGKPASITSTPRRARARATSSFSAEVMDAPGDCSPSRRVVSKMRT